MRFFGKAHGRQAAVLATLVAMAAIGCGESSAPPSGKLTIVGYSALGAVYQEGLEPGFEASPEGENAFFYGNLFNGSTGQVRALLKGERASLVHLSESGGMERLVEAGLVSSDWDEQPYHGIAQNSVVVIMTRKGNPRGIHSFDDLIDTKINVMETNPFTSGFGRWAVMAIYGSELHEGKSEAEALEAVKAYFEHSPVQANTNASAVEAFSQGESEAVLCYENEAIKAQAEGADAEYFVPPSTILIETPIAVTEEAPEVAHAFLDYILSDAGQRIFARFGYRPVNPKLVDPRRFPTPEDLFTIADLGGWAKFNSEFFDGRTGKVARIEKELGFPTKG